MGRDLPGQGKIPGEKLKLFECYKNRISLLSMNYQNIIGIFFKFLGLILNSIYVTSLTPQAIRSKQ